MSKRNSKTPATDSSELTSTGMPWSEVPDSPCPYTEWLGGRHGPAQDTLPSIDNVPIPEALLTLPVLHADRPRGSKPMADVHGACRTPWSARLRRTRHGQRGRNPRRASGSRETVIGATPSRLRGTGRAGFSRASP